MYFSRMSAGTPNAFSEFAIDSIGVETVCRSVSINALKGCNHFSAQSEFSAKSFRKQR